MSTVYSEYAFFACMDQAASLPGVRPNPLWTSRTDTGERILDHYYLRRGLAASLEPIHSIATTDESQYKAFLRRYNFDLHTPVFVENCFAVAAFIELLIRWRKTGGRTEINSPRGKTYPAVRFGPADYTV